MVVDTVKPEMRLYNQNGFHLSNPSIILSKLYKLQLSFRSVFVMITILAVGTTYKLDVMRTGFSDRATIVLNILIVNWLSNMTLHVWYLSDCRPSLDEKNVDQ